MLAKGMGRAPAASARTCGACSSGRVSAFGRAGSDEGASARAGGPWLEALLSRFGPTTDRAPNLTTLDFEKPLLELDKRIKEVRRRVGGCVGSVGVRPSRFSLPPVSPPKPTLALFHPRPNFARHTPTPSPTPTGPQGRRGERRRRVAVHRRARDPRAAGAFQGAGAYPPQKSSGRAAGRAGGGGRALTPRARRRSLGARGRGGCVRAFGARARSLARPFPCVRGRRPRGRRPSLRRAALRDLEASQRALSRPRREERKGRGALLSARRRRRRHAGRRSGVALSLSLPPLGFRSPLFSASNR